MVCSRLTTRRVTIPLCPPLLQTFSPLSILCPLGFPFKFFKDSNRRKKEITNLGFRDLKRHQAEKTAPVSLFPPLAGDSVSPPPSLTGLSVCCLPLPSAVPYGPFCLLSSLQVPTKTPRPRCLPLPAQPRLTESRPRDDCLSGTQSAPSWCRPRLGMGRWRCREVP